MLVNKKTMEHEGDGDTNYGWCTWDNPQRIDEETRRLRNQRTSRDHPNYSIIKIDQNTEKGLVELRRLAVTQAPVYNHQQKLEGKTLKE